MSTCCPTESKQIPEVNFYPERGSQQREQPGKGVIPATDHVEKTHQDIEQQCRPDLPADRICAVAQEIAQLEALRIDALPGGMTEFSETLRTDPAKRRATRRPRGCSSEEFSCRLSLVG